MNISFTATCTNIDELCQENIHMSPKNIGQDVQGAVVRH